MFILVWITLLQLPYLEKVSNSKLILYLTLSMLFSIFVFVMFAAVYKYENCNCTCEELKSRFDLPMNHYFET